MADRNAQTMRLTDRDVAANPLNALYLASRRALDSVRTRLRSDAERDRGLTLAEATQRNYLNPMFAPHSARDTLAAMSMLPTPVVSDVAGLAADTLMYVEDPESRTPLNYGLSVLGLLPGVPALATVMPSKRLTKEQRELQNADALLGRHPTTTPGRIVNQTKTGGGYSVNLPSGAIPTDGLMVGKYSNTDPRNTVLPAPATMGRNDVRAHVGKNVNALTADDAFLGTWYDPASGNTYLDVSKRFKPDQLRQASKYGERSGQLALYDVGGSQAVPIGNWEQWIQGPEFQRRMDAMAQTGRNYLAQHPASEWWDMHGSAFERVYGPQNLPQVAGFTASTAPNSAPRENLQTMSEYMRRHIQGEPVLQPDWRVPEGQMTRQPGKRIGMEKTRRGNLVAASRGDLAALRKDKVREEAMALMGDPNAVVLDRHWGRLAEDPASGVYTAAQEGVVEPGRQYQLLKNQVAMGAQRAGRSPRDYSADAWTGIRETIKNTSNLFGQPFRGSAITGDSKSYADIFDDLIRDKAAFLKITREEMEARLRAGDATLLSLMLASPLVYSAYQQWTGPGEEPTA